MNRTSGSSLLPVLLAPTFLGVWLGLAALVLTTSGAAAAVNPGAAEARPPSAFSTAPEQIKAPYFDLPAIGRLATRPAKEIASSNWSIGGETLDRDFAVYENYRRYLGPLGAKGIRLQAGWAKCEKTPGVYEWSWLDAIVNDAVAQGVRPWLEVSYGNPIYPGGGGTGLGGSLPSSPEALAAWDNWVQALVRRCRDRVREWEIWNEPDGGKGNTPGDYTDFFIRTARIVRQEQPGARIYALALAGNMNWAESFLRRLRDADQTGLMDAVTVHGYPRNPDNTRDADTMGALLAKYAPHARPRQGETGAPSKRQPHYALANMPWNENTQAKWNLRRMLAHHAKDVPFNLFTIMDLHYTRGGQVDMNWKGQLAAKPDKTVAYCKPSYLAAQRVFSTFDDTLERIRDAKLTTSAAEKLAVAAWRHKQSGAVVAAVWMNGMPPQDSNRTTPTDLTIQGVKFTEPVLADLLTGSVFALRPDRWSAAGGRATFKQLPLYDSPLLIAEKAALAFDTKRTP